MADEDTREPDPAELQPSPDGEDDSELVRLQQDRNLQDMVIEWARSLMLKYLNDPQRTVEDSLAVCMDQFGLEDDSTAKYRLVNILLPTLRDKINELPPLLNPSEIAKNPSKQLVKASYGFDAIDHVLDRIFDIVPIVWNPLISNESDQQAEDFEFRRRRMRQQTNQLAIEIFLLFQSSKRLLEHINLHEIQQSEEAFKAMKEAAISAAWCFRLIDMMDELLRQSLFDVILNDWQNLIAFLDHSMRNHFYLVDPLNQNDFRRDREKRNTLCLPFFKLCRLFLSRISKTTKHELGPFSRMTPCQLIPFFRTTGRIVYYVGSIAKELDEITDQEDIYGCLVKVIAAFAQSLECIHDFLDDLSVAPVSNVERKTIETTRRWFNFWDRQLLISLQNVATFAECGFPVLEDWSTVELLSYEAPDLLSLLRLS